MTPAGRWLTFVLAISLVAPCAASAAPVESAENEESGYQTKFFRNLAGGEMDPQRTTAMWRDMLASPTEAASTAAINSWQLVGPIYSTNTGGGRMTGRVRDIDARRQRVLAASGGLWRFSFGAIPMSDGVPATWFGSFATHPFDANTVLLGTGEYGKGNGMGLFKTTDGGVTWTSKPMSPQPSQFMRVRYAPDGSVVHAATNTGYFRSTNGGETWTRTLSGMVSDVTMTNGDPGRLFATVVNGGLWRSLDAGANWAQITSGGIPTTNTGNGAVAATHLYPSDVVWIYVVFETTVYRSQDGGGTWANITPSYSVGNSGYGPAISVCPDDGNTVLYGNVSYNRTTNGGGTWTKINSSHLHADYHVFDWEADGFGVWAGNDGGWFRSTDRGLTWDSASNVMPISQFYSIDCEKNVVGYMVGGTQDNNVLYTPNQALFWIDPAVGSTEGDATGTTINGYDPNQMWSVTGEVGGAILYPRYRTLNGGTTWGQVVNGIAATSFRGGVIRNDNTYPIRLVTSTGPFVYESLDGANWALINPGGFPADIVNLTSSVRVSPSAVLYATLSGATPGQRLYVRDGGSWYERSGNLPAGSVTKVVPHPWFSSASEAWAVVAGASQRISHTTDRGVTWTSVTGDLPVGVVVTDVVPNPRNGNELYAGTLNGCYRTRNGGVNWERWNNGMPPTMITEMSYIDLTTTTGQVFVVAATYGRSVWKRDVSGDDAQPTITLSSPMVEETDTGMQAWFQARLSAPSSEFVTVGFATQDSTATVANNDYVGASGQITFSPGEIVETVIVQVNGDVLSEGDETFKLVLSNPVRASIGGYGVATVQDDDAHRLVRPDLFVTDGAVNAVAISGTTAYIGGSFQRVGAPSGGAVPIDVVTGQPVWLPRVAGKVYAVAPDGTGGWYLGGDFSGVDGRPRTNLAHIFADRSLDYWNPGANNIVTGLAVGNGVVYVAGAFTTIAGVARNRLAAIDASGFATDWNPNPDNTVITLRVNGATVYAAGSFTNIGGQPRNRIAALNATTGLPMAWNPNANGDVDGLLLSGGTLYVGGAFTSIGGQARNRIAALDAATGAATGWNPGADNRVYTLAVDATRVFAGGVFANIGGQARSRLAAIDRASGGATSWAPNPDGAVLSIALDGSTLYVGGTYAAIGGQSRNHLAAVDVTTGSATSWNPDPASSVAALAISGSTVMVGGIFTSLAPSPRNNLAAINTVSGMVTSWDPNANGSVQSIVVTGGAVFAGGSFTQVGGQARNRIAKLDTLSGLANTTWNPDANGTVHTMLMSGTKFMFVGGSFTSFGGLTRNRGACLSPSTGAMTSWDPNVNGTVKCLAIDGSTMYMGGTFTMVGGQTRNYFAAVSTGTGTVSTFNPNADGAVNALLLDGTSLYIGGAFELIGNRHLLHVALVDVSTGTFSTWNPNPDGEVMALAESSNDIYIGGTFTRIESKPRKNLALARPSTNSLRDWAPNPSAGVSALALNGTVLYVGGSFTGMGGLPQSQFASMLASATMVNVPVTTLRGELSLRLGPNPSSGRVRIEYTLPEAARVRIAIYDVQGRAVAVAVDEVKAAGKGEVAWDARRGAATVAPGLYFARMEAGERQAVSRFVIVR